MKAKESEMNDKITALENENRELKKELGNVLQTMKKCIETTVKEITEGFVSTISKLQDEKEKHRENQLHILTEQISTISSLLQPSSQMPVPRQPYYQQTLNQQCPEPSDLAPILLSCDHCGPERAKKNHVRSNHQPKS